MGMTDSEMTSAVDLGKFIDWVHALKEERDQLRSRLLRLTDQPQSGLKCLRHILLAIAEGKTLGFIKHLAEQRLEAEPNIHECYKYIITPLEWTEPLPPSEACRYDHVIADTPLGKISIEWKGWKKYDSHAVSLDGEYVVCGVDLNDAKQAAEEYYGSLITRCLRREGTLVPRYSDTDNARGLLQAAAYHDAIVKTWEAERAEAQEAINEYGISQPGQREWDRLNLAASSAANHFDFANDMRRMAAGEKPLNCPLWFPVVYVEQQQALPVSLDEALDLFEATACKQTYDMRGGVRAVMDLCMLGIGRKTIPVPIASPECDGTDSSGLPEGAPK